MAQSLEGVWQGNVTVPKAPESGAEIRVTRTGGNSLAGKLTMGTSSVPMQLTRATPETAWELLKPPALLAKDVPLEFVVCTIKPAPYTNIPSGTYSIGTKSFLKEAGLPMPNCASWSRTW